MSTLLLGFLSTSSAFPSSKRQSDQDGLINGFTISSLLIPGTDFTLATHRGNSIPLSGDHDLTFSFDVGGTEYGPYSVEGDLAQSFTQPAPENLVVGQIEEVFIYLVYYLGAASSSSTTATLSTFVPIVSQASSTSTLIVTSNIPGSS